MLQEFIDKIVVHHRKEICGEKVQKIDIYYKMIGHIKILKMSKHEPKSLIKNFGRKKRRVNCLKQLHSSKKDNHRKTKPLIVIQHGTSSYKGHEQTQYSCGFEPTTMFVTMNISHISIVHITNYIIKISKSKEESF